MIHSLIEIERQASESRTVGLTVRGGLQSPETKSKALTVINVAIR